MLNFNQRYWKWIIVAASAIYAFIETRYGGDFYIYLSAAADLGSGIDIFEKRYVDGYHYFYSVLFAVILNPFAHLPFLPVKFFWLFFNVLLFFDLLRLLYNSGPVKQLSQRKRDVFIMLVFIESLRFLIDNIHTSQITILILWCCIKGLILINKDKTITGSLLLAIGINIKLLPLVLLPYLLYRGYFKAFILSIIFCVAMVFLPSLIIGHGYNMQLLGTWLRLINPSSQIHVLDVDERSFHGLSTLLSTLLVKNVPDVYALQIPRNIADLPIPLLSKIILGARLLLVAFTLFFLKLPLFRKSDPVLNRCAEVSYILLIIPLIFPHQQHYAFLFAMPAFAFVLYFLINAGFEKHKIMTAILALIYLVFNLKLLLGAFNAYYDHFKIITYAALLLIPLLAVVFSAMRTQSWPPSKST